MIQIRNSVHKNFLVTCVIQWHEFISSDYNHIAIVTSPIVIRKFMMFVGKKFYKSVTLLKCSLGYVDYVEKMCKKLHHGNACFQALLCTCTWAKWLNFIISEYMHVIYHFFICIFPTEQLSCWHQTLKMYPKRDIYEIIQHRLA